MPAIQRKTGAQYLIRRERRSNSTMCVSVLLLSFALGYRS